MKTCRLCGEAKDLGLFPQKRNTCKACRVLQTKTWRHTENGNRARFASNLKRYSLTIEQYNQMLEDQAGKCKICEREPGAVRLHVDHDHKCCSGAWSCGQCVRGLLCYVCNAGLGKFGDDPEMMTKAIEYIVSYNDKAAMNG